MGSVRPNKKYKTKTLPESTVGSFDLFQVSLETIPPIRMLSAIAREHSFTVEKITVFHVGR